MNYQKDKYQALRSKSEKTLRRLAKKYGYDKLPKKMNNVSYYAKRLSNYIEELQYKTYEQDVKKRNKAKDETKSYIKQQYKQVLKELNNLLFKYKDLNKLNNNRRKKLMEDVEDTILKVFYKNFKKSTVDIYILDFKRLCLINKRQILINPMLDNYTKDAIIEIIDYRIDLLIKCFCEER